MVNFMLAIVIDAFGALKEELAEKNVQSVPAELRTLGARFWENATRRGREGQGSGAVVPESAALEMLLRAQRAARESLHHLGHSRAAPEGGEAGGAAESPREGESGAGDDDGRARVLTVRFGDAKRVYVAQDELETLLIPTLAEARRLKEDADGPAQQSVLKRVSRAPGSAGAAVEVLRAVESVADLSCHPPPPPAGDQLDCDGHPWPVQAGHSHQRARQGGREGHPRGCRAEHHPRGRRRHRGGRELGAGGDDVRGMPAVSSCARCASLRSSRRRAERSLVLGAGTVPSTRRSSCSPTGSPPWRGRASAASTPSRPPSRRRRRRERSGWTRRVTLPSCLRLSSSYVPDAEARWRQRATSSRGLPRSSCSWWRRSLSWRPSRGERRPPPPHRETIGPAPWPARSSNEWAPFFSGERMAPLGALAVFSS